MALTDSEKLQAKMLLQVPANGRYDYAGNDPNSLLDGLTAAQETEARAIIAEFNKIKLDADRINSQGLDSDPARAKSELRKLLALVIGYRLPSPYPTRIGRG
ncbi:hypothetical protein D3C87_1752490 [compost metagenome]